MHTDIHAYTKSIYLTEKLLSAVVER